ncbi:MAG: SDR family NAD(P)-dependent oxidoreductase, partial [Caldisericia bacterium]|nr:SDR family NAD(P)-dependent oxidoreductase [Caldisericia bacterium]
MESIENCLDFSGKVVLVTGSSQGIGAVIALEFAKRKAITVLNFPTEKEQAAAEAVLFEVKTFSPSSIFVQADVRSASS